MKKSKYLIALGFFLLTILLAAYYYSELPQRFPAHFDFSGAPDRWSEKSVFSWFIIPVISGIVQMLVLSTGYFIRKYPSMVNLPEKEKFLAAPQEIKNKVFDLLDNLMLAISTAVQVLFAFILYASYSAAISSDHSLPGYFFLIIIGYGLFTLGIVIYYMIKISSELK